MPKSRKPQKWWGCFSTISFIANLRCSTKDAKLLMVGLNNYIPIYSERLVRISKVPKFLCVYIYIYMFLYGGVQNFWVDLTCLIYRKDFPWQTKLVGYHGPLCLAEITEAEGCLGFIASRKSLKFHVKKLVVAVLVDQWSGFVGNIWSGDCGDQDFPLIRWGDVPKSCPFGKNRWAGDWYTIYHQYNQLPIVKGLKQTPLSTNQWEFKGHLWTLPLEMIDISWIYHACHWSDFLPVTMGTDGTVLVPPTRLCLLMEIFGRWFNGLTQYLYVLCQSDCLNLYFSWFNPDVCWCLSVINHHFLAQLSPFWKFIYPHVERFTGWSPTSLRCVMFAVPVASGYVIGFISQQRLKFSSPWL